jgi:hypothetical protein
MNPEYGTVPAPQMLGNEPLTFEGMCAGLSRIEGVCHALGFVHVKFYADGSGCISVGDREHRRGNFRDSEEFNLAVEEIITMEAK